MLVFLWICAPCAGYMFQHFRGIYCLHFQATDLFKLMLKWYGRKEWVGCIESFDGVRPITAMKGSMWEKHCSRSAGAKTSKDSPFFWAHQWKVWKKCGQWLFWCSSEVWEHLLATQSRQPKADHNFINNLKNNNSTVSQNFVIFWLHLTKLLVQFPGWGFGFIAPYQCSCTVVAIVGLVGEEVDVSTVYIQHIIKKTFNSTPVFCSWFGVWGGNPRKLWHIIRPVRVTCKYCNFHRWFWNTTHWQGTHYVWFQSAVWCCVNGCVVLHNSKVCSAFVLKGRAIHEEQLLDPWRWRHYVPLEHMDHLSTTSCRTGIEKQNGFVSFVALYMLTEKHKMWIFHYDWMNDLSLT